jgi:thioredoxin-dependent peroxiredoxin
MAAKLAEGTKAPAFKLPTGDGDPVTLADFKGKNLVLFFYPKADTPGCTTQACGVRDRYSEYAAANVVVLGVSPDPVPELRAFADKYGLAFTLLSDIDHRVAERYGVWTKLKLGGRVLWGNQRSTVLVDPLGNVARVFPDVKPDEHDELVLAALAEPGGVIGG